MRYRQVIVPAQRIFSQIECFRQRPIMTHTETEVAHRGSNPLYRTACGVGQARFGQRVSRHLVTMD